jgi:hypothetical protein
MRSDVVAKREMLTEIERPNVLFMVEYVKCALRRLDLLAVR